MTATGLNQAIHALAGGGALSAVELEAAFETLLSGDGAPEETAAFLMGLAVRGETVDDLIAGARVMRRHARQIPVAAPLLDTCGTGGLGWTSLNTSTASAIVIAAAGGRVAKHGNRSVPPKTGSADVLEALGVALDIDEATFRRCLDGAGLGFMFARAHHSAMRHVAPVRATLGIRTIFNLLGPLTNPAGASHQILGVSSPRWVRPMAEALAALGTTRAWVVHGAGGIDEISIAGPTQVSEVTGGAVRDFEIVPEDAGLDQSPLTAIEGGTPGEGPFRDIVLLNAAAGMVVLGRAADLRAGVAVAATALDSGAASRTLRNLVRLSQGEAAE